MKTTASSKAGAGAESSTRVPTQEEEQGYQQIYERPINKYQCERKRTVVIMIVVRIRG